MAMNIQIFGKKKCFDTQKAERYFKERGVRYQSVDLLKFGISRGELQSVMKALGGLKALLSDKEDVSGVTYLAYEEDQIERLLEQPRLLKTPIVRNGKQATTGYCPDVWKTWE